MNERLPTSDDRYADVLYYVGWWDCPRTGISVIDGEHMHFDCPFSDELDDYPTEFRVWPAVEFEVAAGMEFWRKFATWRGRCDAGEPMPAFEEAFERVEPPPSARLAVPEWRLDPDRTFVGRVPRHRVRWHVLG